MDTDLRDQLDRSFGDGPPVGDVSELLGRGRRALRRRRLAEGAALLAVAGVVVVGAVAATGAGADRSAPPAGGPATSAAPTHAADGPPRAPQPYDVVSDRTGLTPGDLADIDSDGVVHVRPGVEVVRLLRNPFHVSAPEWSVALVLDHGQRRQWLATYDDGTGGGASASSPPEAGVSFEDWVAESSSIHGPAPGTEGPGGPWPGDPDLQLVRFAGDGERLVPLGAVTLVQQRPHPDLGDAFAAVDDRSAVAEVVFEGRRYYVLARRLPGSAPQYIAVKASDGGATLDDFLQLARARYAEGGGGLL